jgi:hypothetical protein
LHGRVRCHDFGVPGSLDKVCPTAEGVKNQAVWRSGREHPSTGGLKLNVVYSKTDMVGLGTMLQQGRPVIVFVRTSELLYWTYGTDHALLVVGCDESQMYVNDPHRPEAPIAVPRGDFELAWLERDYYYALITP